MPPPSTIITALAVPATMTSMHALVELFARGVDDVLAVDHADAHAGDRLIEGDVGDGKRRACGDERHDIGIDFRIDRQRRDDDVDVVTEAFGEQRPDRPVDEARGQRRLLGRTALALDETARDLARGVHPLFVIDREGEEFDAFSWIRTGGDGGENAGVAVTHKYGAAGLARKLTCFDGKRTPAQLHADGLWQKGLLFKARDVRSRDHVLIDSDVTICFFLIMGGYPWSARAYRSAATGRDAYGNRAR